MGPDAANKTRIVSLARIRTRIRDATHGALVEEAALRMIVHELEACFETLLHETIQRYQAELAARRYHGLYPRARVRADHIRPTARTYEAPESLVDIGSDASDLGGEP